MKPLRLCWAWQAAAGCSVPPCAIALAGHGHRSNAVHPAPLPLQWLAPLTRSVFLATATKPSGTCSEQKPAQSEGAGLG